MSILLMLVAMVYDDAHTVEARACQVSLREHCPEAIVCRLRPEDFPLFPSRSWAGHCWSFKATAVRKALERHPLEPLVYYVDSDFLFFRSIEEVPFPSRLDLLIVRAGQPSSVNSGLVGFRNNPRGRAVARWWEMRCARWCDKGFGPFGTHGTYTDEGYLGYLLDRGLPATRWVGLCPNWNVGLAPWSMLGEARLVGDTLYHVGTPIHSFHFQGFDEIPVRGSVRKVLYPMYRAALAAAEKEVESCERLS